MRDAPRESQRRAVVDLLARGPAQRTRPAGLSELQIHFCGVRGSVPAPGIEFVRYGGHTSCVALSRDHASAPTLILDAGTGVEAAAQLLADAPYVGAILLSHLHWDHTQGLPFFASGDRDDAHVSVVLPDQGDGTEASRVLEPLMSPPFFPIGPTQLRGDWSFATIDSGEREIEGFTVLARDVPHKGGRTLGYRISDGHSALAYMPDHNPTQLGPGEDGFGEYHATALELARDVDVLIHDAQLLPHELPAQGEFGHAVADYAVGLAKRSGARSVVLFHHRHDRTDEALDQLAARLGSATPNVSVAAQGLVLSL